MSHVVRLSFSATRSLRIESAKQSIDWDQSTKSFERTVSGHQDVMHKRCCRWTQTLTIFIFHEIVGGNFSRCLIVFVCRIIWTKYWVFFEVVAGGIVARESLKFKRKQKYSISSGLKTQVVILLHIGRSRKNNCRHYLIRDSGTLCRPGTSNFWWWVRPIWSHNILCRILLDPYWFFVCSAQECCDRIFSLVHIFDCRTPIKWFVVYCNTEIDSKTINSMYHEKLADFTYLFRSAGFVFLVWTITLLPRISRIDSRDYSSSRSCNCTSVVNKLVYLYSRHVRRKVFRPVLASRSRPELPYKQPDSHSLTSLQLFHIEVCIYWDQIFESWKGTQNPNCKCSPDSQDTPVSSNSRTFDHQQNLTCPGVTLHRRARVACIAVKYQLWSSWAHKRHFCTTEFFF